MQNPRAYSEIQKIRDLRDWFGSVKALPMDEFMLFYNSLSTQERAEFRNTELN